MNFKIQAITILPVFVSLMAAIYLSIIALTTTDPVMKHLLLSISLGVFFGGVTMALCWILYWAGVGKNPFRIHAKVKRKH